MKLAVLIFMVAASLLGADEINRIESIVKDITDLRAKYESCQRELDSNKMQTTPLKIEAQKSITDTCKKEESELNKYKRLLKQEQEKNTVLAQKAELSSKENTNISKMSQIIKDLEKELKRKEALLKNKDNQIISLKKDMEKSKEKQQTPLKNSDKQIVVKQKIITKACKDDNKFPKLMMKDKKSSSSSTNSSVHTMKAGTFRLKNDSVIYDSINGNKVYEWEEKTSFTSNIRSDEWIKITGYFVNKVWQKSPKELWVKSINVIKR